MNRARNFVLVLGALAFACSRTNREDSSRTTQPAYADRTANPAMQPPTNPAPLGVAGEASLSPSSSAGIGGGAMGDRDERRKAEAEFKAAKGFKLEGKAQFEEVAGGVKVVVEVEDAPPGKRGIHIHEKPDCSDIPGKSMGEHFNPATNAHALPPNTSRHLGDLGNIEIDKQGKGKLELTVPHANLMENGAMSFLKRALVIHEDEDNGSQPSGASGKPMACAIIEKD